MSANRPEEAKALVARGGLPDGSQNDLYALAFLTGDQREMEHQMTLAAGKPHVEDVLLALASDTEAYYGRNAKARELSGRAVEAADRDNLKQNAARWQAREGLREAELGEDAAARRQTQAAMAVDSSRDLPTFTALAMARVGDSVKASKMADVFNGLMLSPLSASEQKRKGLRRTPTDRTRTLPHVYRPWQPVCLLNRFRQCVNSL